MNAINIPSVRQSVTEKDSRGDEVFTRPWALFFQQVYDRIGGATAVSNTDLALSLFEDAGNGEVVAMALGLERDLNQYSPVDTPTIIDVLTTELTSLREQVAEMAKELDSIKQGSVI